MPQPDHRDGLLRLSRLLAQAAELAGQVERGQAKRPLGERFGGLATGLEREPVQLGLAALDDTSTDLCSDWFARPRSAGQSRSVEWFLPGSGGARFCDPGPLDNLADDHAALGLLLAKTNLLIVVGPMEFALSSQARQALAELSAGANAVWAIGWSASVTEQCEPNWAIAMKGRYRRVSRLLTTDALPIAAFNRGSPLGEALFSAGQARAAESALETLEEHLTQETRQHMARRKGILLRAGSGDRAEADRALRDATESLRRQIDDGQIQAELALGENLRLRTLPTATCNNVLANLLEDLGPADMAEEQAGRIVRLKASSEFLGRVHALLRSQVQEDLASDAELLRSRQSALTDAVNGTLASAGSNAPAVRHSSFDQAAAWHALREMIHLDARYQGEMQVRKWIDRLSYGRRPVFAIMMVSSLVGAAFGIRSGLMAWLAPGILVVFLGGVFWTFRSFRQERQERIDHELLRLRESLGTETRRLYELVLRESQSRTSRHLRELQRDLVREADDRLRACQTDAAKRSEQERREAQDRLKVIDGRLRELNAQWLQAQRLRQTGEELRQALDQGLHELLANYRLESGTGSSCM